MEVLYVMKDKKTYVTSPCELTFDTAILYTPVVSLVMTVTCMEKRQGV